MGSITPSLLESLAEPTQTDDTCRIIAERLKTQMATMGISASQLARRANLRPSFLYDIISGKSTNPSIIKLDRIASQLGVSLAYLISREAGSRPTIHGGTDISNGQHEAQYVNLHSLSTPHERYADKTSVKQIDTASALFFSRQWLEDTFDCTADLLRLFTVTSECMYPSLKPGNCVIVNITSRHPSPAGLFVLFDGLGLVTKRLQIIPQRKEPSVHILSDNAQFPSVEQPLQDIEIMGRVVWVAGASR